MVAIQQSLLIEAPASYTAAFWSDFEQFPSFMENLESVRVFGDGRMRWRREDDEGIREIEAQVDNEVTGRAIGWQFGEGRDRSVEVTFAPLAGDATWLTYTLEYEPDSNDGDLDAVRRRIVRELTTARELVESRFFESRLATPQGCR